MIGALALNTNHHPSMTSIPTVDAIIKGLTHPIIPRINGRTTFFLLREKQQPLNEISVDSQLGGVKVGHIDLILSRNAYNTITPGMLFNTLAKRPSFIMVPLLARNGQDGTTGQRESRIMASASTWGKC